MPGRFRRLMDTMYTALAFDKNSPHLTQADLDRTVLPEEAARLPLRCHGDDCFVHGSELGVVEPYSAPAVRQTSSRHES